MATSRLRLFERIGGGSREIGRNVSTETPPPVTGDALPAPAQPAGAPVTFSTVLFTDDFTGTGLDTSKWTGNEPWQSAPGYQPEDGGQCWVPVPPIPSTLSVADSVLTLQTRKQTVSPNQTAKGLSWTGQVITSRGKFSLPANVRTFTEWRIKVTGGKGQWHALWMMGNGTGTSGWPLTGECDVLEMVGQGIKDASGNSDYGHAFSVFHWSSNGTVSDHRSAYQVSNKGKRTDLFDGNWHTIGYDRRSTQIDRYIDGVKDVTWLPNTSYLGQNGVPTSPLFTDAMHLKISHEIVSANWGGIGLTEADWQEGHMKVDYCRAWQV